MAQDSADVRYLLDRTAIQDVLSRYFFGIDRRDPEIVRGCFTDDVQAHYDERPPTRGIEALMAGFRTFKRPKEGTIKITTHFMGNLNFRLIEGHTAETETNAIAFLVDPADQVAMRSLRYIDRLRRQADGWRISDRIHTLDWSCRMPATFAATFAQRVSALPART
jgi:hypothetical protein